MTPSQQAKSVGLDSLAQMSRISGVAVSTLKDWHKHKQQLFKVLLIGCVVEKGNIWTKPKGGCLMGEKG